MGIWQGNKKRNEVRVGGGDCSCCIDGVKPITCIFTLSLSFFFSFFFFFFFFQVGGRIFSLNLYVII